MTGPISGGSRQDGEKPHTEEPHGIPGASGRIGASGETGASGIPGASGRTGASGIPAAPKAERQGSAERMSAGRALLMITQVGISMLAPIFLGGLIGHWLDQKTGLGFLFLVFLLFGFLAAFRNVYRLTKPFYAADLAREKQEQEYWKSLERERKKKSESPERAGGSASAEEEESGPRAADGVTARRQRAKLAGERREAAQSGEAQKSRRQEAEEEFDAWRKRNGR